MPRPKLKINPAKCTGCEMCVSICTMVHEKVVNPKRSRIRIVKEKDFNFRIIVCMQCDDPACVKACPVNAIYIHEKLNIPIVDSEKCTGCGKCVEACPFKAIWIDPVTKKAIKCDLCMGDPQCVKYCSAEAITYG